MRKVVPGCRTDENKASVPSCRGMRPEDKKKAPIGQTKEPPAKKMQRYIVSKDNMDNFH